ncbi:class I SAM-dependent methyltransferase [Methylosinus sporium]|uniref:class I SAM-dependent methyltransferase n=1 Tax=Methylosinus sporium TaxID=428 RepID=UPI00383A9E86
MTDTRYMPEHAARAFDAKTARRQLSLAQLLGARQPKDAFFEMLSRHLHQGTLIVRHNGVDHRFGAGDDAPIVLRVLRDDFFSRVLAFGNLGMGEAFMAQDFEVEDGRLVDCLTMLCRAGLHKKLRSDWSFLLRYAGMLASNRLLSPATNVRRHYDIGEDVFDAFLLDRYQVYSCGYAHSQDDDADLLQQRKLDRICQKLEIEPGQSLLDIGCGKGGMLIHAALNFGARGVGVTNSVAHHARAQENAAKYGVSDRVRFILGDYREIEGSFDRIVSVGMLEHVRAKDYPAYFGAIERLLAPKGRGLVHVIGCNTAINRHDPFIQKYVFPGSDTPKLSAMTTELEKNCLAILDVENMARHYAVTLRRWLEAFRANSGTLDPVRYDTVFKRMWEYYLSCGIASAMAGDQALYQLLFTKDYHAPYRLQRV